MSDDTFTYVTFIDSTPERVFEALTSPEFTERYWAGRRITSDWAIGSDVKLYIEDSGEYEVSGEVIAFEPPTKLSYSWLVAGQAGDPSVVTFELFPMGESVRLTVTHEPLPKDNPARQGWAAIMSSLKSLLEVGVPLSATQLWRRRA